MIKRVWNIGILEYIMFQMYNIIYVHFKFYSIDKQVPIIKYIKLNITNINFSLKTFYLNYLDEVIV